MQPIIIRRQSQSMNQLDGLQPVLARIYAGRGISKLAELEHGLGNLLSFDQLAGIETAVSLLATALHEQWRVMVIGDFDADGATSTALAVSVLQSFGLRQISFLVPNRFDYGYGLTPEIVIEAHKRQPDLIITVDNGIANFAGVAKARELGIKVLITDHHLPTDQLPNADAIVNPNLADDRFVSKNLAGVGVVFYVMAALRAHLRDINFFSQQGIEMPSMAQFLDLVALGTVADVVVLDKNNRILVKNGLERMRQGFARPGIKALLQVAGRDYQRVTASDLGFAIGPRLNAAGRLQDMSLGIECLLTADETSANEMAMRLDELNKERRQIETGMKEEALAVVQKLQLQNDLPYGLCLYRPEWHQGVVGIVASRIKEKTNRPVIAFAKADDQNLKGSARSIVGLHIRDVLAELANLEPDLMIKFGGHAMAAGLTISEKNIARFAQAFAKVVGNHLAAEDLEEKILTDGELAATEFSLTTATLLQNAGPFGQGFPEPTFDNEFVLVNQRLVGERHLKLVLGLPNSDLLLDAIAFNVNLDHWPNHRANKVRAVYKLDINYFNGSQRLQLIVDYLQVCD